MLRNLHIIQRPLKHAGGLILKYTTLSKGHGFSGGGERKLL